MENYNHIKVVPPPSRCTATKQDSRGGLLCTWLPGVNEGWEGPEIQAQKCLLLSLSSSS